MRRIIPFFVGLCLASIVGWAAAPGSAGSYGSPLETVDFGEAVFAADPEFDLREPATSVKQLLAILDESPDMAKHLRAIKAYGKMGDAGDMVPHLRELVIALRGSKRDRARIETAYVIGLLVQEDAKETRAQYIKDLVPVLSAMDLNLSTDPWACLVAAMLYGTVSELQGNWYDKALYAICYGYDEAPLQLSAGSFLLAMDLAHGGNERLQWFAYLALTRAQTLAPANHELRTRTKNMANQNMGVTGYRSSKWIKILAVE